jgi:hypothetical protein
VGTQIVEQNHFHIVFNIARFCFLASSDSAENGRKFTQSWSFIYCPAQIRPLETHPHDNELMQISNSGAIHLEKKWLFCFSFGKIDKHL